MGSFFIFTDDKKYFQLYFDDIRGPNFEFYRLFVRYGAIFCGQRTQKIEYKHWNSMMEDIKEIYSSNVRNPQNFEYYTLEELMEKKQHIIIN